MYFGQHSEDIYLDALFPGKKDGICVDVGAYDGIGGSNTYHFELKGWKCLCVEPIPSVFEKCKNIRKECFNCCIGEKDEESKLFTVFELTGNNLSAISSLQPDERLIESHKHLIENIIKCNVKVRSLTSLLDEVNFPIDIDFVSIDTENTELDVLKGFDLNKYNVKVFVIENNFDEPFIEEYLKTYNYKKINRIAVNDFYIKN